MAAARAQRKSSGFQFAACELSCIIIFIRAAMFVVQIDAKMIAGFFVSNLKIREPKARATAVSAERKIISFSRIWFRFDGTVYQVLNWSGSLFLAHRVIHRDATFRTRLDNNGHRSPLARKASIAMSADCVCGLKKVSTHIDSDSPDRFITRP